jgi:hypothetical protein
MPLALVDDADAAPRLDGPVGHASVSGTVISANVVGHHPLGLPVGCAADVGSDWRHVR